MKRILWLILLLAGFIWVVSPAGVQAQTLEADPSYPTYVVKYGDTLSYIALQHHIPTYELIILNDLRGLTVVYPGQTLHLPARLALPAYTTHYVRPGEMLSTIAAQYGVTVEVIQQYSYVPNPDLIEVGQPLYFPLTSLEQSAEAEMPILETVEEFVVAEVEAETPAEILTRPVFKQIVVNISEQRAYTYEDGVLKHSFIVSTGEPGRRTATGLYEVLNKLPMAHSSAWNLDMPNWLGIYWSGGLQNGFHALPIQADGSQLWAGYLGTPVSYGCIILSQEDSQTLYDWAEVGTQVIILP